jgi:hypothetical protein
MYECLQHETLNIYSYAENAGAVLAACFLLVFCLAYSSTLKMDAVHFLRLTQHQNPEERQSQQKVCRYTHLNQESYYIAC